MAAGNDIGGERSTPSVYLTEYDCHEYVDTESDPLTAYVMKGEPGSNECDDKAKEAGYREF